MSIYVWCVLLGISDHDEHVVKLFLSPEEAQAYYNQKVPLVRQGRFKIDGEEIDSIDGPMRTTLAIPYNELRRELDSKTEDLARCQERLSQYEAGVMLKLLPGELPGYAARDFLMERRATFQGGGRRRKSRRSRK